ncbi:SDR family NAD(P)-dependent oxidoreductase [Dyella sp. 333MFSha]|uniref:SDR family NAD(P)-dependent oxidoreductase n=1 Tax=Dyella sp. 333MFSha TaxID=1798240 RepID=UPI0031B5D4D6
MASRQFLEEHRTMSQHRTALVTGASSGIGLTYADRLARRGFDLVLVARRTDRLEQLAAELTRDHGIKVTTLTADLSTETGCRSVEQVIADDASVDFLVNNAGMGKLGALSDTKVDDLATLINVNVLALARLSLAAMQAFTKRGSGTVVNMCSISAFRAVAGGAAYSGSKAFVLNFTRSLNLETRGTDVRFQCVLPGPVKTEFFAASGVDDSLFPAGSFITSEQLVDAALRGLDLGEEVTIPTLEHASSFETLAEAFTQLREDAGREGIIATRYRT